MKSLPTDSSHHDSWWDRTLQKDWDRLVNELGKFSLFRNPQMPAHDLVEDDSHYELVIDLPGCLKEDIRVELAGRRLMVSAIRREETVTEEKHRIVSERSQEGFRRMFYLPAEVETESLDAEYRNGVLRITLPKAPAVQKKEVKVRDSKSASEKDARVSGHKENGKQASSQSTPANQRGAA
jgi:HSP20 family protein